MFQWFSLLFKNEWLATKGRNAILNNFEEYKTKHDRVTKNILLVQEATGMLTDYMYKAVKVTFSNLFTVTENHWNSTFKPGVAACD